jgi:hypothetical protein
MANNEASRAAARAAFEAYKATPGFDTGEDETTLSDLIADLAFLAEHDMDVSGEYVIERGAFHFVEDKAEQELEDDDEDEDVIDGEVVEPLELEEAHAALPPAGYTGPWA